MMAAVTAVPAGAGVVRLTDDPFTETASLNDAGQVAWTNGTALMLWDGAAVACNIHTLGAPHCPWCVGSAGSVSYGIILLAQAIVSFWPAAISLLPRLLGGPAGVSFVGWNHCAGLWLGQRLLDALAAADGWRKH